MQPAQNRVEVQLDEPLHRVHRDAGIERERLAGILSGPLARHQQREDNNGGGDVSLSEHGQSSW
jgi:hypothetical protein